MLCSKKAACRGDLSIPTGLHPSAYNTPCLLPLVIHTGFSRRIIKPCCSSSLNVVGSVSCDILVMIQSSLVQAQQVEISAVCEALPAAGQPESSALVMVEHVGEE